jgi:hypothetical protein
MSSTSSTILHSAQGHRFISPDSCGSSVGYRICVEEYTSEYKKDASINLSATITLTDCCHLIDWSIESTAKIDAAIGTLREFRKQYVVAERLQEKLKAKQ